MSETPPKSLAATTRHLVQLALRVYLLCLAPITYFQRSLIYHPNRCERLLANHANLSHAVVDVTVRSHDGLELNGWLTLAGTSRGENSVDFNQVVAAGNPVVLYFPGNAGNRARRATQFDVLGSLNAYVLLVDYRGYADNPGKPSEADFAKDARSIWNHLTQELGVPPQRIVIYGESLGGGVATRLASELCQEGIEPGGLIIQSTFSSLVAVAQVHFPVVPVSWLLVDRYPSDQRIIKVTCPILQIHGQQDTIVPFWIGQKLFDAAPAQSSQGIAKQQIVMPHTDHNDVYSDSSDDDKLINGLKGFLDGVDLRSISEEKPDTTTHQQMINPTKDETQFMNIDWTVVGAIILVALAAVLWWFSRSPQLMR
ncbi:MAG: alpha/beta hydrolase [Schlesneria sp.]